MSFSEGENIFKILPVQPLLHGIAHQLVETDMLLLRHFYRSLKERWSNGGMQVFVRFHGLIPKDVFRVSPDEINKGRRQGKEIGKAICRTCRFEIVVLLVLGPRTTGMAGICVE
jgi:hypothetical protein